MKLKLVITGAALLVLGFMYKQLIPSGAFVQPQPITQGAAEPSPQALANLQEKRLHAAEEFKAYWDEQWAMDNARRQYIGEPEIHARIHVVGDALYANLNEPSVQEATKDLCADAFFNPNLFREVVFTGRAAGDLTVSMPVACPQARKVTARD